MNWVQGRARGQGGADGEAGDATSANQPLDDGQNQKPCFIILRKRVRLAGFC